MPINYFRIWLSKKENAFFWIKPLASEKIDLLITDPDIQKSIEKNKSNQAFYAFIENSIVSDYALLIELKLRHAFKCLRLDEFENPSGFERKEKSSLKQQKYFNTRNTLEFFLRQDINQHGHSDAQLNAFRRWIGLPASSRSIFKSLCELSSSDKNHSALRHYIQINQTKTELEPLLLRYHAIILLNASMDNLQDRKATLLKQNNKINKSIIICKKDPDHKKLEQLDIERLNIRTQLNSVSKQFKDQLKQRCTILEKVLAAQQVIVAEIPLNLEQTYKQVCARYNKHEVTLIRQSKDSILLDKNKNVVSDLYSNKLLPSFWNRRGKSAEQYWQELFSMSITIKEVRAP